jgi:hypothetical protein
MGRPEGEAVYLEKAIRQIMKIEIKLTEDQKLILQILYELREHHPYHQLEIDALRRISGEVIVDDVSFSSFVWTLADISKPSLDLNRILAFPQQNAPSAFDKDIGFLSQLGLIERYLSEVKLTEEGFRIAKGIVNKRKIVIRPSAPLRTTIFVACAFGYEDVDNLYSQTFAPICKRIGYEPIRVDKSEPGQTITELIMEEITKAECVIAICLF